MVIDNRVFDYLKLIWNFYSIQNDKLILDVEGDIKKLWLKFNMKKNPAKPGTITTKYTKNILPRLVVLC